MEFLGLLGKYRVDRPLDEQELCHRLKQNRRLNLSPHYQLSVIEMNSTYLETTDKWYGWKGVISAAMLAIILIFASGLLKFFYVTLTGGPEFRPAGDSWWILTTITAMSLPLLVAAAWTLSKESFAYTHYPMRFNRITRMVYVFRPNGTVLSIPWDQVFFTLGHILPWDEWEVRGHVLDADNVTVRETFALSYVGSLSPDDVAKGNTQYSSQDFVRAHWEFIRRYMEDGPQSVSGQVQFCMPVNRRREGFRVGAERVFANFAGAPFLIYWVMFPFCSVVSIVRWFAMRTCKIPQWPQEVKVNCIVEPDDPYAIEGALNGERVAVFPEAALAAGVRVCAPPCSSMSTGKVAGHS
jgi:hypothetical protein